MGGTSIANVGIAGFIGGNNLFCGRSFNSATDVAATIIASVCSKYFIHS